MLYGIIAIIAGYLLGSIPSAYIVTRIRKGIDIRDVDCGNMGAGAVIRQVGKVEGAIVVVADVGKGAASIYLAHLLGVGEVWVAAAGLAAILGHNFPVYVGFRGGQGAACIIGVFLALAPVATAMMLCIIAVMLPVLRNIFNSIGVAGPFLPLFIWLLDGSMVVLIFSLVIVLMMLARNVPKFTHMCLRAYHRTREKRARRAAVPPGSTTVARLKADE